MQNFLKSFGFGVIMGHKSCHPSLGHPLKLMGGAARDSYVLYAYLIPIHMCHAGWH